MTLRASVPDEFVTHLRWKGKVGESVSMQMTELDFAQSKLLTTEAMWMTRHAFPLENSFCNRASGSLHIHANGRMSSAIPRGTTSVGQPQRKRATASGQHQHDSKRREEDAASRRVLTRMGVKAMTVR